jgi:trans-aconitate methyltransferase
MSEYDRNFWEERWSQALREHGDRVAQRPPNAHLTAEVGDLRPGRALDAGCGHGSDTLWLAARGCPLEEYKIQVQSLTSRAWLLRDAVATVAPVG